MPFQQLRRIKLRKTIVKLHRQNPEWTCKKCCKTLKHDIDSHFFRRTLAGYFTDTESTAFSTGSSTTPSATTASTCSSTTLSATTSSSCSSTTLSATTFSTCSSTNLSATTFSTCSSTTPSATTFSTCLSTILSSTTSSTCSSTTLSATTFSTCSSTTPSSTTSSTCSSTTPSATTSSTCSSTTLSATTTPSATTFSTCSSTTPSSSLSTTSSTLSILSTTTSATSDSSSTLQEHPKEDWLLAKWLLEKPSDAAFWSLCTSDYVCKVCDNGRKRKGYVNAWLHLRKSHSQLIDKVIAQVKQNRSAAREKVWQDCQTAKELMGSQFGEPLRENVSAKFKCEECEQVFDTPFERWEHCRTTHPRNVCFTCCVDFGTKEAYVEHRRLLINGYTCNVQSIRCPHCHAVVKRHCYSGHMTICPGMNPEMRSKRNEQQQFHCSLCAKLFSEKRLLKAHLQLKHKNQATKLSDNLPVNCEPAIVKEEEIDFNDSLPSVFVQKQVEHDSCNSLSSVRVKNETVNSLLNVKSEMDEFQMNFK